MAIRFWLGVAQLERARASAAQGSVYVGAWPPEDVAQMNESDGLVLYSPRVAPEGEPLRCFTAIGRIAEVSRPGVLRRRVDFFSDRVDAPIRPLRGVLDLTADRLNWGYQLRRGLIEISRHDFEIILNATRRPSPDDRP